MINHLKKLADENKLIGPFKDIPNDIYHSIDCPGISSTRLKIINESFKKFRHSFIKNEEEEESKDLLIGSAFHDFILVESKDGLFSPKNRFQASSS